MARGAGGRSPPRARRGAARGCLLTLLVLVALGYLALKFAPPYLQHLRFREAMRNQTLTAEVQTDEEIRRSLLATAEELGIPLDPRRLVVRRARGTITISADWTVEVVLPKIRRVLHFDAQATAPLTFESQ